MGTRSDDYKELLIGHEFLDATYGKPTTHAVALLKSAASPGDAGADLDEATASGYGRATFNPGSTRWEKFEEGGVIKVRNKTEVVFSVMTAAPDQSYVAWAILDSATVGAGTVKHFGDLPDSIDINSLSYLVKVPAGSLVIAYN